MGCSFENFDWVGYGYILFMIGSILYFIQALNPFIGDDNDDNNGYYYQGSPMSEYNIAGWISLIACIIFVIESVMYIIGWYVSRNYGDPNIELSDWYLDWNFWGNLFFLIGSIAYLFTSITFLDARFESYSDIINVFTGLLFIFDSLFYLFAIIWSNHSRVRKNYTRKISFYSNIDWYFVATVFYIFGSILYYITAILAYYKHSSSKWNLFASFIFIIDSPLYLLSSYQFRSETDEIEFLDRDNLFLISNNRSYVHLSKVHFSYINNEDPENINERFFSGQISTN